MTPVMFDGCFGWLHPAAGRRGVVLCSAHGSEELGVHRTWRMLAERLAAAGLPTLRFDYHGAGDSLGDDDDPDTVRAWLDSVHAAVRHLRTVTGVDEVALVGLRLGATLATVAATEMSGMRKGEVDRLVLLAPCVTGRTYAHELKAMARLAGTPQPQPDAVECAGYRLTADTLTALRGLDLMALPCRPAAHVLLLDRTDVRDGGRLAAGLSALGSMVEVKPFTSFAPFMNSVQRASVPSELLDAVTNWLRSGEVSGSEPYPFLPARLESPGAVETAVLFGPEQALFGMLCEPTAREGAVESARPTVLLLNSGATHHVGSGRMSVFLARHLAGCGFASFRMDITGIGDSGGRDGRRDNLIYCQDACADTSAALDWLAARGLGRCVIVGLCAGATLALHTALKDERVVGQVLINPGRFVLGSGDTAEAVALNAIKRTGEYVRMLVADGGVWRALMRRDPKFVRIAQALAARGLQALRFSNDVACWFRHLSARDVRTLLLYSADDVTLGTLESHLGHGGRRLKGLPNVRLAVLEGADHSLLRRSARDRFVELLESHLATVVADDSPLAPRRAARRTGRMG